MPQEEKRSFDDMATELLNFVWNPLEHFEDKEAEQRYRLQRARTFLEMKFGHVSELQKKVEALQKEVEILRPLTNLIPEPPIRDPFFYHPDQGDD